MVINEDFQTFRLLMILKEVCCKSVVEKLKKKKPKKIVKRVRKG